MMRIFVITFFFALTAVSQAYECSTPDVLNALLTDDAGGIILTRPEMQHSWATPDDLFRIHYDTEGPLAVYHPNEDIDPVDGIPDYVNRCAEYLHASYEKFIVDMGFDPPPFDGEYGGDSRYDIYLTNVPAQTTPESQSDQYPGRQAYTSFIQLGHDMRIPRYPDDPYPFLKVSAAHEYFHAVEFAYRAYSNDSTLWWFESCAVWAEEVVFDDVNDVYFQLPSYLQSLNKSLYLTSGAFIYGAWLFPEFISENLGYGIIKKGWEKFASFDFSMDALRLAFIENGLDFNIEYSRHIIWNYFTAQNYHSGFYEEGGSFGHTIEVSASYTEYPIDWTDNPVNQQNVSGVYIEFIRPDISKGTLVLEYSNNTGDLQYLGVAAVRTSGEVNYSIYRVDNNMSPAFSVPDFAGCEKVIMTPVWGYEGVPTGDITSYAYRAFIDSVSTSVNSEIPNPVEFSLSGAYPNPFNGSVIISFLSPLRENYALEIFDITGRLVMRTDGFSSVGINKVNLNFPRDIAGGVYLYQIRQAGRELGSKVLYLK